MVVQEAKAKELNDKVVEATVAVATTGDAVQLAQEKKLGSFAYSATLPSARIVLLLLKIN
jgi:hypothetical protein